MQLCKLLDNGKIRIGWVRGGHITLLDLKRDPKIQGIFDILAAPEPDRLVMRLADVQQTTFPLASAHLLAPIDRQEVWAAGVTYKRSKVARESESASAATFYDRVYTAERPELFFKATAERVAGPGHPVRVRIDSRWTVPEPELALYITRDQHIVGYSIGNDMSARDIEGENPLYLPQAKIYQGSCALGPVVTLASAMPPPDQIGIELKIERAGGVAFQGATRLGQMARTLESLVEWLFRENSFPNGAVMLTGTGIVPPDDFSLRAGDRVRISITGIGELMNPVE
jgi:2-dehydro-3-deoxy-D-arabinonate dehydratase